jgi:flagellar motor switch protein FliG
MALLGRGNDAAKLLDFMSDDDMKTISRLIGGYSKEPERERKMRQILKHLSSSDCFSSLADVHPAWILERLKLEPPRVVGIILRFLPSRHVRYLLKNLPPMLCEQIPNIVESFSVEPAVLETIRRRFESHFAPMRISRTIEELGLENLYYLKEFEIEELFKELGISEMAIALSGMGANVLKIIYNRLDVKDAKKLKAALDGMRNISPESYCEARRNFLSIDSEGLGSEKLLRSVGTAVFAGAIAREDSELLKLFSQKISPSTAYLLKRLVDENRMRANAAGVEKRKQTVLCALKKLAREGRIDEAFGGFEAKKEISPFAADIPSSVNPDEEPTRTLSQLA